MNVIQDISNWSDQWSLTISHIAHCSALRLEAAGSAKCQTSVRKPVDLYVEGAWFESQHRNLLSWLKFCGFPQSVQADIRIVLWLSRDHFPNLSISSFMCRPTFLHCNPQKKVQKIVVYQTAWCHIPEDINFLALDSFSFGCWCVNISLLFRLGTREKARESVQEGAVETILVATDRLFASTGDAAEMVRQARVLGQATAQLIQAIKVTWDGWVLVSQCRSLHATPCCPLWDFWLIKWNQTNWLKQ